uniref:uncharacterized protein LOC101312061 n=1 Tax=Fragaria vesca subsp. vesca TaxID=101020 RepID=UPI0005CB6D0F|nr:PREDICTED: uncharacterized protein LOC101312061 [Fragaria vesca subsp. vesca]XP_011463766.1 PREDICTED: uncharacterized protein LOC101312061 [Fragaria vesca subsp. vesca]XP_011463767.1 PREDICTED: uncharacterized protein LOC101312061 [Fragaria vesca subsp. vesca]XP_011463769.1 PREDICTED: uncharacterized protein LOC101312061 [Fragaria vesca subsp. vesca]
MPMHLKFRKFSIPIQPKWSQYLFIRLRHFQSNPPLNSPSQPSVAIFWDLETRPPKSVSPFEAAGRLKTAASSFGLVRHMIAYAPRHACNSVPQVVGKIRKERNRVVIRDEANICRVCGRRFYTKEKLVNHFRVHESEHMKRLSQIESASGSRRVKLVGKYAMKMEKYRNAVRDVMIPKQGNGLVSELKRAGFWVRSLPDKPRAGFVVVSDDIVEMMDERRFECLVLVSDDSEFVDVVMEARRRCVKTVVVGDLGDGGLKRAADSGFLWREILLGKAKKEAVSVVRKWKDSDILKRLEWRYKPDEDRRVHRLDDGGDGGSEDEEFESFVGGMNESCLRNDDSRKWWELDSDADAVS